MYDSLNDSQTIIPACENGGEVEFLISADMVNLRALPLNN